MSFELACTFYRALNLQPVQDKKVLKQIFLLYVLIGWGLPTVNTGVFVMVNYTTDYIRYGVDGFCWIGHTNSFYVTSVAVRYANYSKNISTVSHEFTPGGGDPHAKTSSVNRVVLHYTKNDGGEKTLVKILLGDGQRMQEVAAGKE